MNPQLKIRRGLSGFLPSQLPNLAGWWRFNTGITITGAGVSQWNDQSGNARHLLQATDSFRPTKESDGSITFDGVDNYLQVGWSHGQPATMYLLFKPITHTAVRVIHDGGPATGGNLQMSFAAPSPNYEIYANGAATEVNTNLTIGIYNVSANVYNGTSSSARVNNNTKVATGASIGTTVPNGVTIGSYGDGTFPSNIQVKEAVYYASAHTNAQQNQVISYLMTLGGL